MNFNKSSMTEIIVHSALIVSEELLLLISLSKKWIFVGHVVPKPPFSFQFVQQKNLPFLLFLWQNDKERLQRYACCSPVEAIRTLRCLCFFFLLLLLKSPVHLGVIRISKSA